MTACRFFSMKFTLCFGVAAEGVVLAFPPLGVAEGDVGELEDPEFAAGESADPEPESAAGVSSFFSSCLIELTADAVERIFGLD